MKDYILFSNTFNNRRTNGSNHAYWTKFFSSILVDDENIGMSYNVTERFDDLVPMFSFLSRNALRAVEIFQYSKDVVSLVDESNYKQYLTAWKSVRIINEKKIPVLTIHLLPSAKNVLTAKELINAWYNNRREINQLLEDIYSNQAK